MKGFGKNIVIIILTIKNSNIELVMVFEKFER